MQQITHDSVSFFISLRSDFSFKMSVLRLRTVLEKYSTMYIHKSSGDFLWLNTTLELSGYIIPKHIFNIKNMYHAPGSKTVLRSKHLK